MSFAASRRGSGDAPLPRRPMLSSVAAWGRRLTPLGWWGLPEAMRRAWTE